MAVNAPKNDLLLFPSNNGSRPPSGISSASAAFHDRRPTSPPDSSNTQSSTHERSINRTVPPWVLTAEDLEDDDGYLRTPRPSKSTRSSSAPRSPRTPPTARPASHHYHPKPTEGASRGRHYDQLRERTPVTITTPVAESAPRWAAFMQATNYSRIPIEGSEIVSQEWMKEHGADLDTPWQPDPSEKKEDKEPGFWLFKPTKRKKKFDKMQLALMRSPKVPVIFRSWIIVMSVIALALSSSIFILTGNTVSCGRGSSTYLAIIVDVVAIPYTLYVTYDEYINPPLGLRTHGAKTRLLFLDLAFIVFDAANLSVAFGSLTDPRWVCQDSRNQETNQCERDDRICRRQVALTVTLLIALISWLSTFSISMMRIIDRLGRS